MGMKLVGGATASHTTTFAEGDYDYYLPGDDEGPGRLVVSGAEAAEEQTVRFGVTAEGHFDVRALSVRPGPVRFEVKSDLDKAEWGMHLRPVGPRVNWVSAAYLTTLQDFRDLFSGEFLAPDRSFGIRSITLLFTDITGSTELYERLGDARAYALVQQHFELMTAVIRRREGGIVKTIGDAVMAAFPVNADALDAALEIQEGFAQVSEPLRQITVKIGLHRGPTIAVTSNRMMDYFGRTVNVAARVQSASEPGEVLVTEAVLADPEAARRLQERGGEMTRREVLMKGIAGPVPVVSVRVARRGTRRAARRFVLLSVLPEEVSRVVAANCEHGVVDDDGPDDDEDPSSSRADPVSSGNSESGTGGAAICPELTPIEAADDETPAHLLAAPVPPRDGDVLGIAAPAHQRRLREAEGGPALPGGGSGDGQISAIESAGSAAPSRRHSSDPGVETPSCS